MKSLTSAELRQMFLDFFQEKQHRVEPSQSLIPHEDPTLLWINSGVATMKKYFDGRVVPDNPRMVNAQKSIRTDDIENVGMTARHHTFFEMLGNFSVGDYFKKEAIPWAWEFLTSDRWVGFNSDLLSVTIHTDDDEAFAIWHEDVGLPADRIIRLDEENFWDIGAGPCGPNSEVFYDRGPAFGNDENDPELFPGGENERYLEVWNLVFSQFNHNEDHSYTPLPKKNIDTGLGLERMVSIIQDGETNYDTDLFLPIIRDIEKRSGKTYRDNETWDTAFRVIADHIRTVSFAIADGGLPSNEGRGYVLRRLLRRAVRFGKSLDLHEAFMYSLVPTVADIMKAYYPEVDEKTPFIQKVIEKEENRFHETINEGLAILKDLQARLQNEGKTTLDGSDAFKLYDTYGFPIELTEEYMADAGYHIDREGFQTELEAQRERARAARKDEGSMQIQGGILADIHEPSEFIGYDDEETISTVSVIIQDGHSVDFVSAGQQAQVMLNITPFYAESGGQVADGGVLFNDATGLSCVIQDVQKAPNGQHLHHITVEAGSLKKGTQVQAFVNEADRKATTKNHTATHLLHQALKDVLGNHVEQAGSLVAPERLRFDFSHYEAVSDESLQAIEDIVNTKIAEALDVAISQMPIDKAKTIGATALFGEKYGDVVRVVNIDQYSIELCGGCHVPNTGRIGLFYIVSETGIGAGTRRIEAVTSKAAYEALRQQRAWLREAADLLHTPVADVPVKIQEFQQQYKDLVQEKEAMSAKAASQEAHSLLDAATTVNGIQVIAQKVQAKDMDKMRAMVDDLKDQLDSAIIVLGMNTEDKVNFIVGMTKDVTERGYHAGHLIKDVAGIAGGGGGGRPDMAQAGGKKPEKLPEALAYVTEWVTSHSD